MTRPSIASQSSGNPHGGSEGCKRESLNHVRGDVRLLLPVFARPLAAASNGVVRNLHGGRPPCLERSLWAHGAAVVVLAAAESVRLNNLPLGTRTLTSLAGPDSVLHAHLVLRTSFEATRRRRTTMSSRNSNFWSFRNGDVSCLRRVTRCTHRCVQ